MESSTIDRSCLSKNKKRLTDLSVTHVIALVETDASRCCPAAAAAVAADGRRRIERVQVVEVVAAVARLAPIPQRRSSCGPPVQKKITRNKIKVPTSKKGISDFYDLSFFFYPSVTLDRPVLYLTTVHK